MRSGFAGRILGLEFKGLLVAFWGFATFSKFPSKLKFFSACDAGSLLDALLVQHIK